MYQVCIKYIQCGYISNQFPIYNISLESDYIFFYLIIKIFTDISSIIWYWPLKTIYRTIDSRIICQSWFSRAMFSLGEMSRFWSLLLSQSMLVFQNPLVSLVWFCHSSLMLESFGPHWSFGLRLAFIFWNMEKWKCLPNSVTQNDNYLK